MMMMMMAGLAASPSSVAVQDDEGSGGEARNMISRWRKSRSKGKGREGKRHRGTKLLTTVLIALG